MQRITHSESGRSRSDRLEAGGWRLEAGGDWFGMTSTVASTKLWSSLISDEYPPEAEVVWTTEGETVRKGQWFWGWEPPALTRVRLR